MGRHRMNAADMEARAAVHARKIEQQDDEIAGLRRQLATSAAEHRIQGGIIRRRNAQVAALGLLLRWLLQSYAALARIRPAYEPARVLDTGTPGVEVTR